METLKKRIAKIEAYLNPHSKETFDLVGFITQDARLEQERLMKLSQSDFENEMMKPLHVQWLIKQPALEQPTKRDSTA